MGKRKGTTFENKIYKILRDVDINTKRTLGSGSSDEAADIHFKNYVIECKHYAQITDAMLDKWFKKLIKSKGNKDPIVIFKQNHRHTMVMYDYEGAYHFMYFDDWIKPHQFVSYVKKEINKDPEKYSLKNFLKETKQ